MKTIKAKKLKPREWKGFLVCDHGQHDDKIYDTKAEAQDMKEFYKRDFGGGHAVIRVKIAEVKRRAKGKK